MDNEYLPLFYFLAALAFWVAAEFLLWFISTIWEFVWLRLTKAGRDYQQFAALVDQHYQTERGSPSVSTPVSARNSMTTLIDRQLKEEATYLK
jgi:hypothetical protein